MGASVYFWECSDNARHSFPEQRAFYGIAIISGASSLAYEVLWARILTEVFGDSRTAVTLVLAAFMGGLALGALFARSFDRLPANTARSAYCVLELAVATHSVLLGLLFESVAGLLSRSALLGVYSLSLFPLPILLGMTLPAIASLAGRARAAVDMGSLASRIYALHTLGACFGVFGVTQLEALPVPAVATANIALAWVARCVPVTRSFQPRPVAPNVHLRTQVSIMLFITGFVAFLLEVGLSESFAAKGATVSDAFGSVVTLFLVGPALGAWAGSKLIGKGSLLTIISKCQLLLALSFLLGFQVLPNASSNVPMYVFALLPGAFLSGLSFALLTRLRVCHTAHCAEDFGSLCAVNAAGSVCGALCTGFLLIPIAGIAVSMYIGVGITAILGLTLLANEERNQAPHSSVQASLNSRRGARGYSPEGSP